MIVGFPSHLLVRCDHCGEHIKAPRHTAENITAADVDDLRTLARRRGWALAIVGGVFEDVCLACQEHHSAAS
jgi:hypothetical protein